MKRRLSMLICGLLAASSVVSAGSVTALAAPKINPYKINQAEFNFGSEGVEVKTEGDISFISGLEAGDYFYMKDVDFSDGLAKIGGSFRADGIALLDVRLDAVDGSSLGNIKLSDTKGEFTTVYARSKYLTGKHNIYFVGTLGNIDVDYWAALATPGSQPIEPDPVTPSPDPDPQPAVVDPYGVVEAESGNVVRAEVKTDGDVTYVSGLTKATLLEVKNVAFDGSAAMGVSFRTNQVAIVEVRDGKLNGEVLATLRLGNTQGHFKTSYFKFPDLTGSHNLIFVPKLGTIDFDSWTVLKAPVKPNPNPVDPDPVDPTPVDPDPVDPTPVDPDPVDPTPVDPTPVVTEGVAVEYTVNNWGSGYQVQFKVKNDSDKTVDTWALKVNKNDLGIDASWNVNVEEEAGYYVITPVSWNSVLAPGQFAEFGVQGSSKVKDEIEVIVVGQTSGTDPVDPDPVDPIPVDPDPVDPTPVDPDPVDPTPVDPDPVIVVDGLDLEYTINGQGSYTINFKVVNNTDSQVNGWTLKLLKSEVNIDSFWCVKVASEGAYYVITPESWNSVVNAGDGAFFGIQGSGTIGSTLTYEFN